MANKNDFKPPNLSAKDRAHSLVKVALSAIPTIGGPASELFAAIIIPPIENRRQTWMEEVGKSLTELLSKNLVTYDDLSINEIFLDTVLQATQIAMRTTDKDKREALRNAILNAALPSSLNESLQLIFLELIDQFTPWHLHLLKLLQNPASWVKPHDNDNNLYYIHGISEILERDFPELKGKSDFYDLIWGDLSQKRLVSINNLHTVMTAKELQEKRTTNLGDQFLQFIENPEILDSAS